MLARCLPALLLLALAACCSAGTEESGKLLRPEKPTDAQRVNPGLH